jgi:hypothetical protein
MGSFRATVVSSCLSGRWPNGHRGVLGVAGRFRFRTPHAPGAGLCPMSYASPERVAEVHGRDIAGFRTARRGADSCRDSTRPGGERHPDGHDAARARFSGAFAGREPVQAPALRPSWQHVTRRLIAVTPRNEVSSSAHMTRGTKPSHGSPRILAGPFVPESTLSPRGWPCQDQLRVDRVDDPTYDRLPLQVNSAIPLVMVNSTTDPGGSIRPQQPLEGQLTGASRQADGDALLGTKVVHRRAWAIGVLRSDKS